MLYKHITYIFKCPHRVDNRSDLALLIHGKQSVHNISNVGGATLSEEQLTELEASNGLVIIVEFDRANLVHLPPLMVKQETQNAGEQYSPTRTVYRWIDEVRFTRKTNENYAYKHLNTMVGFTWYDDGVWEGTLASHHLFPDVHR